MWLMSKSMESGKERGELGGGRDKTGDGAGCGLWKFEMRIHDMISRNCLKVPS